MSNEPEITETRVSETAGPGGEVTAVTVSITISAKALGADAFIRMEETRELEGSSGDAVLIRDDMIAILREQAIDEAVKTADAIREKVASTPRGAVSVHPMTQAPASGTQFGHQAPAVAGPAATVAVANGAAPAAGSGEWLSVKSRFGDSDIRFLPTSTYPTEKLEQEVARWLAAQGLNPDAFKVWDNRPGDKGLEAGVPNGCVAAIKVSKEAKEFVPADLAAQAVARVKFNSNGTLYIWFTKEAEAAIKYGALERLALK